MAVAAGFDSTDVMNQLRHKHAQGKAESRWFGVDCIDGGICDTFENYIWEPSLVKKNAIAAATEVRRDATTSTAALSSAVFMTVSVKPFAGAAVESWIRWLSPYGL